MNGAMRAQIDENNWVIKLKTHFRNVPSDSRGVSIADFCCCRIIMGISLFLITIREIGYSRLVELIWNYIPRGFFLIS